ncbi:hypothetical protein I4U23_022230 [Adineta vaga]|nr:hypothetical protein I4U23_022230 [Adineta vaga]
MDDSIFIVNHDYPQSQSVSSLFKLNSFCRHSDEYKQKIILIWLHAHYDETEDDYQHSFNNFQHLTSNIYTFNDSNVCIDFLTEINHQTKKLLLIIDGIYAKNIIPLIENCSQIDFIFVFRNDIYQYKQWSTNYPKIKGVFTDIHLLIECLKEIIDPNYFTMIDIIGPSNNKFNTSYDKFTPIYWYSAYPFVYDTVNRALRTVDIDLLLKLTFFIGDLHKQIEGLHSKAENKERFTVYRGQGLTKTECEKLEVNIGGFISFNCFLSTSTTRNISQMFADTNSSRQDCNSVLFEIEINPEIPSSPYTSIEEYSQFASENEILFSTHTIFRIDRVTVEDDGLYHVNLSLTSIHDQNLYELIDHRRKEIEGRTSIHRLAHLLYQMGKFKQAKEIYQQLLGIAYPLDEILQISHYISRIDCHLGDFGHATSQQAIAMQFNDGRNPALTADVYAGMAEVFLRSDMLEDSLELYGRALRIAERSPTINDHSKVLYMNNIGSVFKLQNNYDKALTYFQKALDIALTRFPSTHPDIANIYQNIGSLYFDKRDFYLSIDYLNKSLDVRRLSLLPDHPSTGNIHYNLSKVYTKLNQWNEAIYHANMAIEILKKTFSDGHFEVREIQAHLDSISIHTHPQD